MTQAAETADEAVDQLQQQAANALTPHDWGTKPWKSAFLIALSRTRNASAAARHIGMSRTYVSDERKADPVFKEAWAEAMTVGNELLEQIAHTRATVGEPRTTTRRHVKRNGLGQVVEEVEVTETTQHVSDALLRDQLRSAMPEKYADRRDVRHFGPDGGPVEVEVGPRVRTAERTLELIRIGQQLGLIPGGEPAKRRPAELPSPAE